LTLCQPRRNFCGKSTSHEQWPANILAEEFQPAEDVDVAPDGGEVEAIARANIAVCGITIFRADNVAKVPKGTAADFPPKDGTSDNRRSMQPQPVTAIGREFDAWWRSPPHFYSIAAPTARI
jgi:hypothetical protein